MVRLLTALVAGLLGWLLRRAGAPAPAVALCVSASLLLYAQLVGAEAPVMRATCMALAVLLGLTLDLPGDLANLVGLAAVLLLVHRPLAVGEVGFQLSFVATLGMLYVVRGLALLMTNGLTINNLAGDSQLGNTGFEWLGFNRILGIPVGVIIMVIVAIILGFVLGRTKFGRWMYAAGGNERAAELSGVPVRRVTFCGYVLVGALTGLAAVLYVSPFSFVQTDAGQGFELAVITAVVVGGTNIFGGQGTVLGSILGVLLLGVIRPGLVYLQNLTGLKAEWGPAVQGALILAAVLWDAAARRRAVGGEG